MSENNAEQFAQPAPIAPESQEIIKQPPLDAIFVAGMGPVQLEDIKGSDQYFTASPLARRNSQAAKLIAGRGLTKEIYMSGFQSNKAINTTEAEVQGQTYSRMIPTHLPPHERAQAIEHATKAFVLEPKAETTFSNILRSLNMLDQNHGGHFDGKFAVLSSEFHLPRIQEMLKAFGLHSGTVLAAERILAHYGYTNIDPINMNMPDGTQKPFTQWSEENYNNQPVGLENLQDNPSYVTLELSKIESNKRLWEVASSVKRYYQENGISLPDCYNNIPDSYEKQFDFDSLRAQFASIPFTKHPPTSGALSTDEYKQLAEVYGKATASFLEINDSEAPKMQKTPVNKFDSV